MSKINIQKIVADTRKLYAKDKKINSIISTGDEAKQEYAEKDCIVLPKAAPLAKLLGLPGIPYNKIIQLAGKPDSGKSTQASEVMAIAQSQGVNVILIDSEEKFDAGRFTKYFKGKPEDLLMVKTNEILKGCELVRKYILAIKEQDKNAKILFVWDSVGGSQSRSHAERELDAESHAQPGTDARENSSAMKMLVSLISKYPDSIAGILVNQTYAKIGFMQKGDKASGGSKIEFHSSFIVMLKQIKTLTRQVKGEKIKTGIVSRATVTKNHLSRGESSIHQLDFEVTAEGARLLEGEVTNESDESDE